MIRFDKQAVADASLSDLDSGLVDRFSTPQTRDERSTLLRKLGMAVEVLDESELKLTIFAASIDVKNGRGQDE